MRIKDITESKTQLNEAVWFIPLIVAATRVGGGMLIKQMAKKGAQAVAANQGPIPGIGRLHGWSMRQTTGNIQRVPYRT